MESGRYDRHLRRMRTIYARRRSVLIDALGQHAPGVRLTGLAAGFHAVAHLPESADEQAVVTAALGPLGRPVRDGHVPRHPRARSPSARARVRARQ
jgi:DNA-binding transcriptional MocR family regulator